MLLNFGNGLYKTSHFDPEMAALADRHYSRQSHGSRQFAPPGRKLVLRNSEGTVLFVWVWQQYRLDKLEGYNCTIFRNESKRLSSEIVLEAEGLAVKKWGHGQAFTYIDVSKTRSKNPGCCFKKAGWAQTGMSANGKHLLTKQI